MPPTVATAGVLLLQAPPPVASVNAAVPPKQMLTAPVGRIGEDAFTVTTIVAWQPVDATQVMVATPAETPVTIPVVAPTVATEVLLLFQVTLPAVVERVVVPPVQTDVDPEMAGPGFTVTIFVAKQPASV